MLLNHQEREGGEEMAWDVKSHLHVTFPFEFSPSDWGAEEEAAAGWKQKKSHPTLWPQLSSHLPLFFLTLSACVKVEVRTGDKRE